MRSLRIIPCLDIDRGRVVKGVNFLDLRDAGDPVDLARHYYEEGADELVFLDITASGEGRSTVVQLAERVADQVFIPFTVGGGIRKVEDIRDLLLAGADKVSLNTAAIENPGLISAAADRYGAQCVVVAIDARRVASEPRWEVFSHGGKRATGLDVVDWSVEVAGLGAGEILLTSMDGDGTQQGYDLDLTRAVSNAAPISVIASGGAGQPEHLLDACTKGEADAVLVASILHDGSHTIRSLKQHLGAAGVPVRL